MDDQELFDAAGAAVPAEFADLETPLREAEDSYLDRANVVGVGVGRKITKGEVTDEPAVMVLVSSKLPASALASGERIGRTIAKATTDVLEVGHLFAGHDVVDGHDTGGGAQLEVDAETLARRVRPVRPGYSVGHPRVTAGTIGAGCYDLRNTVPGEPRRYYILSNNHVLANSNDANIGDPVWQPGRADGGGPADAVGRLARFVPIRFDGSCNYVDAAIAEVPFDQLDRDIYWNGYPSAIVGPAEVGELVKKTGRTTHFTTGRITAVGATVNVNYGGGRVAKFCRQIVTTDMSAGGDSGSLVLDLENKPVGLLFAGSSQATILNPIATVQLALNVRLWP